MSYVYIVHCLICPRSGFELAAKNQTMRGFQETMREQFLHDPEILEALKNFEEEHRGMVLESFVIESDTEVTKPEKEILPEIRKKHPGAVLFSCDKMCSFATP